MIQQDYLLKQIEELGKVISELISMRQEGSPDRKIEIIDKCYEMIGLNKNELISNSTDEIINYLNKKEIQNLEILESIANIMYEESFMIKNKKDKQTQIEKTYKLISYVDKNSNCFSFQRQQKLNEVSNQIQ